MILSRFPPLRIAYHPVLRCRFFHPTPAISLNYNHGPAVPWSEEELKFLTAIVTTSAATGV